MKRALLASLAAFGLIASPTIATATTKTEAKVVKSEKKAARLAAKKQKAGAKAAAKTK